MVLVILGSRRRDLLHLGKIGPAVDINVADISRVWRLNLRKAITAAGRSACTHTGPMMRLLGLSSVSLVREQPVLESISIATIIQLLVERGAHSLQMLLPRMQHLMIFYSSGIVQEQVGLLIWMQQVVAVARRRGIMVVIILRSDIDCGCRCHSLAPTPRRDHRVASVGQTGCLARISGRFVPLYFCSVERNTHSIDVDTLL